MTAVVEEAAAQVRAATGVERFPAAVVLGSGMGEVASRFGTGPVLPYRTLFPASTASAPAGHAGCLAAGDVAGQATLFFQGRFHLYQELSAYQAALPAQLAHRLGCRRLLLTNAAGGIHPDYRPGDFMYLLDHLNLLGDNPLRGLPGPPFLDLQQLYRQDFVAELVRSAAAGGRRLHRGVYAAVPGPSYETPAEVRALQRLGADAVGMSTVPEAILARHYGIEVVAVSLIANRAAGLASAPLTHAEVLHTVADAVPALAALCRELFHLWR